LAAGVDDGERPGDGKGGLRQPVDGIGIGGAAQTVVFEVQLQLPAVDTADRVLVRHERIHGVLGVFEQTGHGTGDRGDLADGDGARRDPMVSLAAEPVVPAGWGTVVDPVPAVVADPVVVDEPLAAVVVDADLVLLPHALITSPPAATTAANAVPSDDVALLMPPMWCVAYSRPWGPSATRVAWF